MNNNIYKLILAFGTGAALSILIERAIHRYRSKSEVMKGIPKSAINFHKHEAERHSSFSHKWL